MGIKRLNNFLEKNNALKYHDNISDFIKSFKIDGYQFFNTRNKSFVIGVDLLLYAHKFEYSCDSIYPRFLNQILNFMSNQIIPIYIIDGIAPNEKNDVINLRIIKKEKINEKLTILKNKLKIDSLNSIEKNKILKQINKLNKNNINITSNHINNLTKMFDIFNIPYIRANGEADNLIAKLFKKNVIDACLSEDMDILVFGCKKMIKFKSNKVIEYDLDYILKKLNIDNNSFIEIAILFGCDYLKPILKNKPDEIFTNYNNCKKFSDLFNEINLDKEIINKYIDDFYKTKKIFKNLKDENLSYSQINVKIIDYNLLNEFLNNICNYTFNKNTKYQISHINYLIKTKKFSNVIIY